MEASDPSAEFVTARATVKLFAPQDAREVFECISPELTKYMAWEPPSMETFEARWRAWLPGTGDQLDLNLVAREGKSGRFLGRLGLHAAGSLTPELGIWLRTDVHGMGLGYELVAGLVRWASRRALVTYFEYPVAEQNVPSRRIAVALGGQVREQRVKPKYAAVVYHIPPWTGDE